MNTLLSFVCGIFVLLVAYSSSSSNAANSLLKHNLPKYEKHPLKIVNGTDAEDGEFPYMVQVRVRDSDSFYCGGSIIGDKWILTAGHCVHDIKVSSIVYGTNILYDAVNTSTSIKVKNAYLHPKFFFNRTDVGYNPVYDVGILELEELLPLNATNLAVQAIQLADSDEIPIHVPGLLAGWGVNDTFGDAVSLLQKVQLQLLSTSECSEKITEYSRVDVFNGSHNLCSDDYYNGECYGDSGSPFVINGIQYGIVSWSLKPCGIVPGTYSRITNPEYREFIRNVTGI